MARCATCGFGSRLELDGVVDSKGLHFEVELL